MGRSVLGLRTEETASTYVGLAANMLNKQLRRADKG